MERRHTRKRFLFEFSYNHSARARHSELGRSVDVFSFASHRRTSFIHTHIIRALTGKFQYYPRPVSRRAVVEGTHLKIIYNKRSIRSYTYLEQT